MKQWTEEEVVRILQLAKQLDVTSLNQTIDRKGVAKDAEVNVELGDLIEYRGPSPDEIAEENELREILIKAVRQLEPRQARIINLRFGLETGKPLTLDEVGNIYGVTRERIRQVEMRALKRLRWILITKYKINGDY